MSLKVELLPHQSSGIEWMKLRETSSIDLRNESIPYGGILSDDVGLGKTLLTLALLISCPMPKNLILVPKSLVMQWKTQIQLHTTLSVSIVENNTFDNTDIVLASHSILNRKNTISGNTCLHSQEWDRVIIDEAHILRNKKSKTYIACSLLRSTIRWALTATPVMNRMTDFVHIMEWIGVSQFLCQCERDQVANMLILRRTRSDIHDENTIECSIQVKHIPFSSFEEAILYKRVFEQERTYIKNSQGKCVTDLLEHLLRVRQLCIHPQLYLDGLTKKTKINHGKWEHNITKLNALIDCLNEHRHLPDKSIVFCQFVYEMNYCIERLKSEGYNCVRLDGTMNINERHKAIHMFTDDDSVNIFVIQINTGGQGINLQIANRIYIMSPDWNPAVEHQAIGRAYRNGQTKHVYVTKFCISSCNENYPSVEENIIKLQQHKKKLIANILNDKRIFQDGIDYNKQSLSVCSNDIKRLFGIHIFT